MINVKKKPSRKVKRARIVEMMNAIYGFKGSETFTSKIKPVKNSKSSSGNENYNFEVLSSDGNKMENIVILYSCGKSLNDLIRSNDVKTPDPKKYINDFEITDIQFCTQEDHINQLGIPYTKNQKSYKTEIDSIYQKFLKE